MEICQVIRHVKYSISDLQCYNSDRRLCVERINVNVTLGPSRTATTGIHRLFSQGGRCRLHGFAYATDESTDF